MNTKHLLPLGLCGLGGFLIMTGLNAIGDEQLVRENGKISALALPFDKSNSAKSFETATFGIG